MSKNRKSNADNEVLEPDIAEIQNVAGHGASAIKSKFKRAIEAGIYSHGDRLLPERELASSFKTARNTIRSALSQLEKEGLVERRVGSGTFIVYDSKKSDSPLDLNDAMSPLQLIEARFAVEPYVTRLAAINANQNDLGNMEVLINRLEACGADKDAFTLLDGEFHEHLARCARNPLLLSFFQQINRIRTHEQWSAMKEEILTPKQIAAYNLQHRQLFDALSQRNVAGAVRCIRDHLEKAKADLVGADSG
jgi:DNA-binding FadR family transcriptional regulator